MFCTSHQITCDILWSNWSFIIQLLQNVLQHMLCIREKYSNYVEFNNCNTIIYSLKITDPVSQSPTFHRNLLHPLSGQKSERLGSWQITEQKRKDQAKEHTTGTTEGRRGDSLVKDKSRGACASYLTIIFCYFRMYRRGSITWSSINNVPYSCY
jgi:hypothetical protein